MKLERWALIAEVVGSAAIVVSLVLLIVEVRANTAISRIESYGAVTRDFDDGRMFSLSNPESFDLFYRFTEGTLPDMETEPEFAMKAVLVLLTEFSRLERAYLSYQAEILAGDEWDRIHRSECQEWGYLRESEYFAPVTFRMTDSYVEHLNDTCTPDFIEALERRYQGDSLE